MADAAEIPTAELASEIAEVVTEVIADKEAVEIQAEEINRVLIEAMIEGHREKMLSEIGERIEACLVRLADLEFRWTEQAEKLPTLSTRLETMELMLSNLMAVSSIPVVLNPPPSEEPVAEPVPVPVESLPEPEPEPQSQAPKTPEKKKRRVFL